MPTRLIWSLTSPSLARIRFVMVLRLHQKRPSFVLPQMCVKPRKSNVSGLPTPRVLAVWAHNDRTR